MYHMFNVEDAEKYGIACALMLNYLQHWILHNKANGTNYFDGRYWTFNSSAALHEQFPELSERQIRTALNKLVDAGLIMTGNYNQQRRDRTLWYAFTDRGAAIYLADSPSEKDMEDEENTDKTEKSKVQKSQMQITKTTNANNAKIIPVTIRNNKSGISAEAETGAASEDAEKSDYEKYGNSKVGGFPQEFGLIWQKYPSGRKQGKQKAYNAFVAARKKGTSWKKIDDGLEAYKNQIARLGTRIEFVKQGGNWFKEEGWLDDYTQQPSPKIRQVK